MNARRVPPAEGFRALEAHPRFEQALRGPPPRRAEGALPGGAVWAALVLLISVPLALLGGLVVLVGLAFLLGTQEPGVLFPLMLALTFCMLGAFGARAAWRSLLPKPGSTARALRPRHVRRVAARVIDVDGRRGRVQLQRPQGSSRVHRSRIALARSLRVGDHGVAHLEGVFLDDFDVLVPADG